LFRPINSPKECSIEADQRQGSDLVTDDPPKKQLQPQPEQHDLPIAVGDSALQSQTLEAVADAVNYHDWLTSLALPFLGQHPVELGSGLGDYALQWLSAGVPEITVTEVDPSRLGGLRETFADEPRVHVAALDIFHPPVADYSAFVAFNVLEHITEDVMALRAAHRMVRPGGAVVILAPAFQFAMSKFDRAVGHARRYTVESMTGVMKEAGLTVEHVRYVNMPGLLAWFVGMRLLGMTPGKGPLLNLWDRHVIPRTRRYEQNHRAPFGQSVFAVARVPE
jgi:SAM-dependent methyltransferase